MAAANPLEVEGSASKTTAGSWLANSDRRIKTDIRNLTNALETLGRVRPVSFRYTAEYRAAHATVKDHPYLNVVAQEFAQVFPDYVQGSGEHLGSGAEILQVDTYPLTLYATAAIQELNGKLEGALASRDREIEELREQNATLLHRLDALESRLIGAKE